MNAIFSVKVQSWHFAFILKKNVDCMTLSF